MMKDELRMKKSRKHAPALSYVTDTPAYGVNYDTGYTGFVSHRAATAVSQGIAWFTRFDQLSDIRVSHVFTVTGPDTCVEAHMRGGIQESKLSTYFNNPDLLVFFRKPVGLNETAADIIRTAVMQHVGEGYDRKLLLAHAANGSFFGRLAGLLTNGKADAFITWLLDNPDRWICSEYAAWALAKVPRLYGRGVLRYPAASINPQELFEDDITYEPWKRQLNREMNHD